MTFISEDNKRAVRNKLDQKYEKANQIIESSRVRYAEYDVDYSDFPVGHGEKSVIVLLQSGLELTKEEILAIRWHMSAWDLPFQSYELMGSLNAAREKTPLIGILQAADGLSANVLEMK